MNKSTVRYSPAVRERAVRVVFEHQQEHPSRRAVMGMIAAKIGCTAETLRGWVHQAERGWVVRDGTRKLTMPPVLILYGMAEEPT